MKTVNYDEEFAKEYALPDYYRHYYKDARLLFFDIETTGFAAKNTTLYLIGVLWYEDGKPCIRQWFNEDGYGERDLIHAFQEFGSHFTHLVHFNGSGFDLPYLRQKADMLDIPFTLDAGLAQIDILKEIRPYKKLFSLDNMKQVTLEQFLGIKRQDAYNGGELINIYQRYVAKPDDIRKHLLLLHNHDDLLGMPQISQILHYKAFMEQARPEDILCKEENGFLTLHFRMADYAALPRRLITTKEGVYLNAFQKEGLLQIPITNGTLRHFYPDYKNYYYLPMEDMAIHKSVAAYVEQKNREKATKSTCYVKKTDAFLPCPIPGYPELFQISPKDKTGYMTLDSLTAGTCELQAEYIRSTLQWLL